MLYLIDSADTAEIERICDEFPIAGVTTNPAIIGESGHNVRDVMRSIRAIIGDELILHVQTLSVEYQKIVDEAEGIREIAGENSYVKVPVTNDGIKAMKELKKRGFNITATAIFTAQQAMVAAKAGADFVAPYINRLDNISSDGTAVAADIVSLYNLYNLPTRVLAASFKNVEQVHRACMAGVHACTIGPELFDKLIYHPLTDFAVMDFVRKGREFYR
ncbi:MAG: transaldolase family protein [Clostridia bacterium]